MADVVVDQKPIDKNPYDPNDIPEAVRKRAAAVDALYSQQTNGSDGQQQQPSEAPEPPVSSPEAPPPQTLEQQVPPAAPASAEPSVVDVDENSGSWKHRFYRMQGQYTASQKTIGEMQEQMTQLGNELLHAQRMPPQQQQPRPTPQTQSYAPLLTKEDVQNYGDELVDFAQRAAIHAVAPKISELEAQNAEMQRRLAKDARRILDQQVEIAVPNFREIDRDPRWHRWLLNVDVLSGRVRQQLLNEAISTASAQRVISFFRGFLNEEAATGHIEPAPNSHRAVPPREAALDLASIAAPGRARPATGGDSSVPPNRPIYTRAQVKQLYEQHRKGAYTGREAEWARLEADMFVAQREGRYR